MLNRCGVIHWWLYKTAIYLCWTIWLKKLFVEFPSFLLGSLAPVVALHLNVAQQRNHFELVYKFGERGSGKVMASGCQKLLCLAHWVLGPTCPA